MIFAVFVVLALANNAMADKVQEDCAQGREAAGLDSRSVRPPLQCPDGFIGLGEKCYFLDYVGEQIDWTSANSFCSQRESTLVEMETRSEIDLMIYYQKLVDPDCVKMVFTWTGGIWSMLTQSFVWWSTGQKINFFNWGEGQPDVEGPGDKIFTECRVWFDHNTAGSRAYPICEKNPLPTKREAPETAVISPSLACPSSFFAVGDFCYLIEKKAFGTWSQAATNCKTKGGYLAEFNSRMEVDLSLVYLQAEHKDCLTWSMGSIWIGAMEVDNSTIFSWARNQTEMVATNWDVDFQEPNGPEAFNVVAMVCASNFQWFDFTPDTNRNYLCEADPIDA